MKNIKDDEIVVRINPAPTDEEVLKAMENEDDFREEIMEVIKANSKELKKILG